MIRFDSRGLLRLAWMKYFVGISQTLYADDQRRLEKAYALEDPWDQASEREQHRFDVIDQVLRQRLGKVGTILEIGSGEGHHSLRLLERCEALDGLELSSSAVARAQKRCPKARFLQARFPELPDGLSPRYDLVIASEVLYYIGDVERSIAVMNRLGRYCLATFYQDQAQRLRRYFEDIPDVFRGEIHYQSVGWKLYLWRPENIPGNLAP